MVMIYGARQVVALCEGASLIRNHQVEGPNALAVPCVPRRSLQRVRLRRWLMCVWCIYVLYVIYGIPHRYAS